MIFLVLVLQKPFKSSKSRDHVTCIERRMKEWRDESGTMILPLDRMIDGKPVRDVLREKHPVARPLHPTALLQQEGEAKAPPHYPMMFAEINGLCILKSALKTQGGAGPSGVDVSLWRRMCCSFQSASSKLCAALACTAKRIYSSPVDPEPLRPLTASRLVAIDKCPGSGIGEVSRRVIGKAILTILHAQISKKQWGHISCVLGRNTVVRQPFMPSKACMSERTLKEYC